MLSGEESQFSLRCSLGPSFPSADLRRALLWLPGEGLSFSAGMGWEGVPTDGRMDERISSFYFRILTAAYSSNDSRIGT